MENNKFIEDLYSTEYEILLHYARVVLDDPELAQDVVQDTFHEAVRKADLLQEHPKPCAWLMEVLKHKIQHAKRERVKAAKILVAARVNYSNSNLDFMDSRIELEQVAARMRQCLSPKDFYIFRRYFFASASHLQIAMELDITVWASRKRLERIRKEIKRQFPDKENLRRTKNAKFSVTHRSSLE